MLLTIAFCILWACIILKGASLLVENFAFLLAFGVTAILVIIGAIAYILTHH